MRQFCYNPIRHWEAVLHFNPTVCGTVRRFFLYSIRNCGAVLLTLSSAVSRFCFSLLIKQNIFLNKTCLKALFYIQAKSTLISRILAKAKENIVYFIKIQILFIDVIHFLLGKLVNYGVKWSQFQFLINYFFFIVNTSKFETQLSMQ